ncbi:MAG TPA: tetratricopeptide repeat protein, partial [Sphingomicrobium sp.]|nr:tetratricopeptide repeat protein [Sphingomicrobium sp.]
MKSRLTTALASGALLALAPSLALAEQRPAPTPEQRIDRLEKQVQQMQRQVFPKGRPADTAGFSDDPAATQSSVVSLDQRLDALEKQMADLVRQSEENGNRLRGVEAGMTQMKNDEDQRIASLEQKIAQVQAAPPPVETVDASPPVPPGVGKTRTVPVGKPPVRSSSEMPTTGGVVEAVAAEDPGEDAYTQGFHEWEAGQYDQAISTLRAFTAAYPKHKRVSYANNLIGRALLDKGDARAAATALLANYRSNPGGERAPDSLYYLGQALMKLGQPGQACKAYSEMDAVYGAKIRPDLKKLELQGK